MPDALVALWACTPLYRGALRIRSKSPTGDWLENLLMTYLSNLIAIREVRRRAT